MAENMLNKLFYECGKKGVSDITLEVRETNVPAISLYEKLGFEEAEYVRIFMKNLLKMSYYVET